MRYEYKVIQEKINNISVVNKLEEVINEYIKDEWILDNFTTTTEVIVTGGGGYPGYIPDTHSKNNHYLIVVFRKPLSLNDTDKF